MDKIYIDNIKQDKPVPISEWRKVGGLITKQETINNWDGKLSTIVKQTHKGGVSV